MHPVIQASGLGKRYAIDTRAGYHTLRDAIAGLAGRRGRRPRRHIWALDDVSFEVHEGDVLGVIGRNGSGKSTLLKILARVTEPTRGSARIVGRVGSLLEVGTGFHPELTGRENALLNGAILGMKRQEVLGKFDEIVAFAEVSEFIDTPVKFYSSGMYTRLAFAVAAHLEPEILLVDEVLAVGDSAFQKKCIGKMSDVARSGRTVVFVSHNLGVVANLCTRGIVLSAGRVTADGSARDAIDAYERQSSAPTTEVSWDAAAAPQTPNVRLRRVRVRNAHAQDAAVNIDEPIDVEIEFETLRAGLELSTSLHLVHPVWGDVLSSANFPSASIGRDDWFGRPFPLGVFRARCVFPANLLNEGTYGLNVVLLNRVSHIELFAADVLRFDAYDAGGMRAEWVGRWTGVVRPRLAWHTELLDTSAGQ
jgi:lipopolysaccharide transport system ATP-binding protein